MFTDCSTSSGGAGRALARSAVAGRPPGLAAEANGRREWAEERRRRTPPQPEPGAAAAEVLGVGGAAMVAGSGRG